LLDHAQVSVVTTGSDRSAGYRLLYEIGSALASQLELDQLCSLVTTKCREVVHAEGAAILLLDEDKNELYFPWVAEETPETAARLLQLRFPAGQGVAGEALRLNRSLRVDDASSDPRFYREIDRQSGVTTRNLVAVPLQSSDRPLGVLEVVNHLDPGPFDEDDVVFLEALAGSVAVAIENARLYAGVKASEELLRARVGALQREIAERERFDEIIGTSPAMAEVFRFMDSAASSPIAVLILGETGTGKELVARGIHRASERANEPFIAINCAAVPETLLESELFGHRRGAFTGALADRRGLFEAANGGTIFLDEVGEMPLAMQAKMLRVLQDGEILPVGESRPRKVDVRVISATHRELEGEVGEHRFREDLYYRLTVFPIRVPPLRERRDDIPLLVEHFVVHSAKRHGKTIAGIEPQVIELLVRFDWPGNVRELQNEIERAVALTRPGESIGLAQLSAKVSARADGPTAVPRVDASSIVAAHEAPASPAAAATPKTRDLRQARAEFEASFIADVLREEDGNVSRAARTLGLSRVMLQRKMKDYGLR
jgi:Nif-specific regulatory protein